MRAATFPSSPCSLLQMSKRCAVLLSAFGLVFMLAPLTAQARVPERASSSSVVQRAGNTARFLLARWPQGTRNKPEKVTAADREVYERDPQHERASFTLLDKKGKALWSTSVQTHNHESVDAAGETRAANRATWWARLHRRDVATLRFDHTHPRYAGRLAPVKRLLTGGFSLPDHLEAHELREYMRQRDLGDLPLEMGLLSSTVNGQGIKKTVRVIPPAN